MSRLAVTISDEELLALARVAAAKRNVPLRQVVESALRTFVAESDLTSSKRIKWPKLQPSKVTTAETVRAINKGRP